MEHVDANEIRKIIVEELGSLRYAEIKNVRENLHFEFIEKELEKYKKLKRNNVIRIVVSVLFIPLFVLSAKVSDSWLMYVYLTMGLVGGAAAGYDLGILNKRNTIYNILKKLSDVVSSTENK